MAYLQDLLVAHHLGSSWSSAVYDRQDLRYGECALAECFIDHLNACLWGSHCSNLVASQALLSAFGIDENRALLDTASALRELTQLRCL